MPVDILYKVWSTGVDCANPAGYSSSLPADGVVKCIKISGFAIPRGHKAKIKVKFDFRPKDTDWLANKKPDLNFRAGFNFMLKKMFTYGYGTQYAQTFTAQDNVVGVGVGKRVTAIGGFAFVGTLPATGNTVRLFNNAAGAGISPSAPYGLCTASPVASNVVDGDGFYFISRLGANQDDTGAPALPSNVAVRRSALQRDDGRHGANATEQARRQGVRRGGLQRRRQPVAGQPDDQPSEQRALERRLGQGHVLRATGGGVHVLDVGARQHEGPEPQRGDSEDRERHRSHERLADRLQRVRRLRRHLQLRLGRPREPELRPDGRELRVVQHPVEPQRRAPRQSRRHAVRHRHACGKLRHRDVHAGSADDRPGGQHTDGHCVRYAR